MAGLGYAALLLALLASAYAAVAYISAAKAKRRAADKAARRSLLLATWLVSAAVALLLLALVTHDFGLEYVASYTSRGMSFAYLLSALWAGNSGSLLFWAWLLALCAAAVAVRKRDSSKELVPYACSVLMVTEAFFLLLLVSVSNPFRSLVPVPPDGAGLNPMLENPGMIFHPPTLLAGYVGLSVPFALAVAALLTRRLDNEWVAAIRRWTLLSWLLLGVGNIIGAWWAYVELGWGGYWAWDPVENAGLMPWLMATAFLHSAMAQRRKGILKVWNMVLIILTFNLAIFGTFITRSGVLSSVHTFGESRLGPYFVVFMVVSLFGSLGLLYSRRGQLRAEAEIESLVSRESTFLLNNLLLTGSTFVVFFGTVFPAISEALRGVRIEVGASFFNLANGPIFLAVILLAGLCAIVGWQSSARGRSGRRFVRPLVAAVAVGLVLIISGMRQAYAVVAFSLCGFVLYSTVSEWFGDVSARRAVGKESYPKAFWELVRLNRSRYGGYLVHLAIVLVAVGVIGSSFYGVEKEVTLKRGEAVTLKSYTLTYDGLGNYETADKLVVTATLTVRDGDREIGRLAPEKYFHRSYEQPVSEVAIRSTPVEDLYVILAGWETDGTAAFQVLVNPLVAWIWVGGAVLLLGGLIALWPDGVRQPVQPPVSRPSKGAISAEDEAEEQVRDFRRKKRRSSRR